MEHEGEIWQEYDRRGARIMNGGVRPGEKFTECYGGVALMIYRYSDNGVEFLFQRRSNDLIRDPSEWDVSAGGHVNYNEPKIDTILRETKEEIGVELDAKKIEFSCSYMAGNSSIIFLYFYDWTGRNDDFAFNDREVQEVKWVKSTEIDVFREKLRKLIRNDEFAFIAIKKQVGKILEKYGNN